MNAKRNIWSSQSFVWWILIIVAACLVYGLGAAHESIWFDETYSVMMASHSPGELLGLSAADNHPPLYYLLLSLVISIFGNSIWAVRALSILGAVGLVSLGAGPVRRIFGSRTAFIYSGVVLFTPVVLIYAHEARMYSLANLCVTASALFGYLAVINNRRGDWILFGLASLAAAYLHYYGLMAVFFMHLVIILWLLFKNRAALKPALITGAAVAVGYLPWLVIFYQQVTNVNKGFWIGAVTRQGILNAVIQLVGYKDSYPPFVPLMAAVLAYSAVLVIAGLVLAKMKKAGDEWPFGLFVLVVLLFSFTTPILISLVSNPIFYARYLVVLDGLYLLLLSLGISVMPKKWLQMIALGFFALANIPTIRNVSTQYFNIPMKQAADYLQNELKPGEPIVTSELLSMGPAFYYLPQAAHYNTKSISGDALEQMLKEPFLPVLHKDQGVVNLISTHQPFWYVTVNMGLQKSIAEVLDGEQGWEKAGEPTIFAEAYASNTVTVTKYFYSGRIANPTSGTLNLHITGLKPPGSLLVALFDNKASYPTNPSRVAFVGFDGAEITYAVDGLDFGDYVIYVFHDENNSKSPDRDSATGLFSEGCAWVNMEKQDLTNATSAREGSNWDNIKYTFDAREKTVEIKLYYAPFPWNK